jgi:tRNA (cytidine/uridine-2'-O-)-methyltransferase
MKLKVVLVQPQIPQNTGSIARMTAATGTELHLIEPLGFELSDRYLKRAGLDYWPEVRLTVHPDWDSFLHTTVPDRMFFFSTKAKRSHFELKVEPEDYFIFGSEDAGLSQFYHDKYAEKFFRIPMTNPKIRSLNLATAAGIVLYEGIRQLSIDD